MFLVNMELVIVCAVGEEGGALIEFSHVNDAAYPPFHSK